MDAVQILALYDAQQRRDIVYPGYRREPTPDVVRHVPLVSYEDGFVLYCRLDAARADDVIREQIDYFERLNIDFEWKYFAHDAPADLLARLETAGFELEVAETVMALETASAPDRLTRPPAVEVRRVTRLEQLPDLVTVQEQVWQQDFDWLTRRMTDDLQHNPDQVRAFVAYLNGQPVSSAWMYFHPGSQFASLWGGSTLPAYRGQGLYTTLLAARLQAAQEKGARFLTLDAGPMSRPILEKLGFKTLIETRACKWTCRAE